MSIVFCLLALGTNYVARNEAFDKDAKNVFYVAVAVVIILWILLEVIL